MESKRVLLIQADTTQTLPFAKSLSKKGWTVGVVVSSKWSYGYGTRYAKNKYVFHDYENLEAHFHYVKDILEKEYYDIVIPMADQGACMLSLYKDKLSALVKYVLPDINIFEKGYDKHLLMEECAKLGISHPKTIVVSGNSLPLDDLKKLKFPVLIKPNHSCGARGITFISTLDELSQKFDSVYKEYGDCHVQEFIPKGGRQVEVQIYIDRKGRLVQSSVISKTRWYPNNGGSSCCNESVNNPHIVNICHRLLSSIGWEGFADFDTIEDPRTGELLIMELNPRVPACVKTAFEAGVDWADVISSEYMGEPHKSYVADRKLWLRHLGFEILWFLNADNRFDTTPNWFNFFGRNIFYQDMNGIMDPVSFLRGTLGNIAKQLSPSFRKSKAGI